MDMPYMELPDSIKQLILYGSGEEAIEFSYFNDRGGEYRKLQPFEGVIPNMQRRHQIGHRGRQLRGRRFYLGVAPAAHEDRGTGFDRLVADSGQDTAQAGQPADVTQLRKHLAGR